MRLQQAQQELGVQAAYLAKDYTLDFFGEVVQDDFFKYKKPGLVTRITNKLNPAIATKLGKQLANLRSDLDCEIATLPFAPYNLLGHRLVKEAHIIHLHWVTGMVDYPSFFEQLNKPLVWTLHDMNPFMGLFHYTGDLTKNKLKVAELEAQVSQIKSTALKNLQQGTIVSPSNWLLQEAQLSKVFSENLNFIQIANPINTNVYSPQEKKYKNKTLTLLFAAGNLNNRRKGVDLVIDALNKFPEPLILKTIGKGELKLSNSKVQVESLGYINKPEAMIAVYRQVDGLLLPSREDNLPNTMVEALSCGTPVISFNTGGMREYIAEGENGCLASEFSADALLEAIFRFRHLQANFKSKAVAERAKQHFQAKNQAKKYLNLYLDLQNSTNPKN